MSTAKILETIISHLVHLGLDIPFIHHFMSRLPDLYKKTENRHMINVKYRKDLNMMLGFLKIANNEISMNSIAFIKSTHIYCLDSCPHGLGGYSHK
jgi:hypothetical protein